MTSTYEPALSLVSRPIPNTDGALDDPLTEGLSSISQSSSLLIDSLVGLSLTGAASAANTSLPDIINSLDEVQGTLSLTNGLLTSDLLTPFGTLQGTYDLVQVATNYVAKFEQVPGTLNLSNGIASGNLDLGDQDFTGSFNVAQMIGSFVSGFLSDVDGTIPFQDGEVQVDIPTPFGTVTGTLGFGGGKFVSDLDTPFGALDFSFNFPASAKYDLPLGSGFPIAGATAVLDLSKGEVQVDLSPLLVGTEISIPLTVFFGTITLAHGIATVGLDEPFGTSFSFNLAEEVGEEITEFLSGVTGTLGVGNGSLSADLVTSVGSFQGNLNVSSILTNLIQTLPEYSGTLTLSDGAIAASLTTPYGLVNGTYNYGQYLDDLASLFA